LLLALAVVGTSCDLTEPNLNEPDRNRALSRPSDIEALVGGTFILWWQVNHGIGTDAEVRPSAAVGALAAMANEVTSSAAHYGLQDIGFRPIRPLLNDPGSSWHPYVASTWQEYYKVVSAAREALIALESPDFLLGPGGQDNARLRAVAKFMQGLALASLGYIYGEAYILDETVDEAGLATLQLRPYGEVMQAGLDALAEAAELADQSSFVVPALWIPGPGNSAYTSQELVRIINSYRARFMAGVARTPTEREAVNWAAVLALAEAGVTRDFGIESDGPGGKWKSGIITATGATSTSGGSRKMHHDIVGPADQTGAWQAWKAASFADRREITVETDDRRIHGPGGPTTVGTQVQRWSTSGMQAARGLYYYSLYADIKHRAYRDTEYGFLADFPVRELDFLKAEAHLRLGNPQAAADLINRTRVANGQLPPITTEGASGPRCVPRTETGACGDLLAALRYEKGLELWLYAMGVRYTDQRGWGKLDEGIPLHLPVPKDELTIAGRDFYTTGGLGGIDAAGPPRVD